MSRRSLWKGAALFYVFGMIWVGLLAAVLVAAFEILKNGIRHR